MDLAASPSNHAEPRGRSPGDQHRVSGLSEGMEGPSRRTRLYDLEYPLEDAGIRPAAEAAVYGVPLPEPFRQVPPGCPGSEHPDHALQLCVCFAATLTSTGPSSRHFSPIAAIFTRNGWAGNSPPVTNVGLQKGSAAGCAYIPCGRYREVDEYLADWTVYIGVGAALGEDP